MSRKVSLCLAWETPIGLPRLGAGLAVAKLASKSLLSGPEAGHRLQELPGCSWESSRGKAVVEMASRGRCQPMTGSTGKLHECGRGGTVSRRPGM